MGGHLALHAAYRNNVQVERCFALSSFLIDTSVVFVNSDRSGWCPPLYLAHGEEDRIVPVEWAMKTRDRLEQEGVRTKMMTYKGLKHDLNKDVMKNLLDWINTDGD
eukprot:TRINITY_DN9903_c0_g1_i1.p1 TRINITY_DN9903_c0_g1~~TRINITY_DN9903_c0_g1_i1.p1  ORF type:complete len:106 (-),score=22.10 TRINITY_DN9903_c0_g1_i1:265-582(-)